jgi:TolB-like protein/Tfp pilus assembly protein PilF
MVDSRLNITRRFWENDIMICSESDRLLFDDFELDLANGELRKAGTPVALQPQPFKVLAFLTSRSGQAATRLEIQRQLWGRETYVDFRCGVNFCIRQIRKALGEGARNHRYIETLHRRGYRFRVPVSKVESNAEIAPGGTIDRGRLAPTGVAILPFNDLGGSAAGNCLADGITELLSTRLAANRSLRVVSQTTSGKYKNLATSLPNIGRELGVGHILEGGVLCSGRRVRVTVRLIDASTDRSRWGATYDFQARDDLDLQDRAVRAMIRDSAAYLGPKARWGKVPDFESAVEVDLLYNTGCYFLNKRTEKALFKAIEYFQRAIAAAPESAAAYAGLARTYTVLAYYGPYLPREVHSKARAAAQQALKLDPGQADAHAVLAYCNMLYGWNWRKAEAGFRKAIAFDPCSVTAHQWYADFLVAMKRHDEAIEEMRRACALDPFSMQVNSDLGWSLLYANQCDKAINQYRHVLEMDPNFWLAHWGLGLAYGQTGMLKEAIDSLGEACDITEGTPSVVAAFGHALGASGEKNDALQVLSDLNRRAQHRYVPAYDLATVAWGLGDVSQTMSWLDQACNERSAYLVNLGVDTRFTKLRCLQPARRVERLIGLSSS